MDVHSMDPLLGKYTVEQESYSIVEIPSYIHDQVDEILKQVPIPAEQLPAFRQAMATSLVGNYLRGYRLSLDCLTMQVEHMVNKAEEAAAKSAIKEPGIIDMLKVAGMSLKKCVDLTRDAMFSVLQVKVKKIDDIEDEDAEETVKG